MDGGYDVDVEQIRTHAGNVEAIRARFEAVKVSSAHIVQDSQAYGLLCGWISGVLEGRHTKQDELIAYVEESLALVVQSLHDTAGEYQNTEDGNIDRLRSTGGGG